MSQRGRVRLTACHGAHLMVGAMVAGWFVCVRCGLVAMCPGCVAQVPGDVLFYCCSEHEYLVAVESYGHRMVWAAKESSREERSVVGCVMRDARTRESEVCLCT